MAPLARHLIERTNDMAIEKSNSAAVAKSRWQVLVKRTDDETWASAWVEADHCEITTSGDVLFQDQGPGARPTPCRAFANGHWKALTRRPGNPAAPHREPPAQPVASGASHDVGRLTIWACNALEEAQKEGQEWVSQTDLRWRVIDSHPALPSSRAFHTKFSKALRWLRDEGYLEFRHGGQRGHEWQIRELTT